MGLSCQPARRIHAEDPATLALPVHSHLNLPVVRLKLKRRADYHDFVLQARKVTATANLLQRTPVHIIASSLESLSWPLRDPFATTLIIVSCCDLSLRLAVYLIP